MAVIAAQYLQGYSFSGRLHTDNMVRRVRKIVREIDSLEAFKLRNIHSHETSPFCNLNLGCVFLAQIQVVTTFTSTLGVNTAFLMKRPPGLVFLSSYGQQVGNVLSLASKLRALAKICFKLLK